MFAPNSPTINTLTFITLHLLRSRLCKKQAKIIVTPLNLMSQPTRALSFIDIVEAHHILWAGIEAEGRLHFLWRVVICRLPATHANGRYVGNRLRNMLTIASNLLLRILKPVTRGLSTCYNERAL